MEAPQRSPSSDTDNVSSHCVFPIDGHNKRTILERCLHPPYPGDSTQEDHHQVTDGPNNRTILERCLHPTYPRDSTQEDHHRVTDEYNPPYPGDSTQEDHHQVTGFSIQRLPSDRCPCPPYSQDSAQEGYEVPYHHQVDKPERCHHHPHPGDFTLGDQETLHLNQVVDLIKVEAEEVEETSVRPDQKCEMWRISKEEDISEVTNPEHGFQNLPEGGLALPQEDNDDLTKDSTSNLHPGFHSKERSVASMNPNGSTNERGDPGGHLSVCPDCGRCFTSKISYKNHRRVHSENRPYSCFECGKRFKQKTHLTSHQACHMREYSFSCAECGRRFTTKAELTVHKRYHTGETIHTCPECGKEFAVKSKLERHRIRHTGNKPFSCTECDYRTAFKSALIIHFRTHTGERPFVCPVCGQDFRQKFLLYRHQRSKKH